MPDSLARAKKVTSKNKLDLINQTMEANKMEEMPYFIFS